VNVSTSIVSRSEDEGSALNALWAKDDRPVVSETETASGSARPSAWPASDDRVRSVEGSMLRA
jgi:hypothetical protein